MDINHILSQFPPWVMLASGALFGNLKAVMTGVYSSTIGFIHKKFSCSILIEDTSTPEMYSYICLWMNEKLKLKRINSFIAKNNINGENGELLFTSGLGSHVIFEGWRFFTLNHYEKEVSGGGPTARYPRRLVSLTVFPCMNPGIIEKNITEARVMNEKLSIKNISMTSLSGYNKKNKSIKKRKLSTIYLNENLINEIVSDVDSFIKNKTGYVESGIPYRRGYMLNGPPGTGKSSIVLAIASTFNLPVYSINFNSANSISSVLENILEISGKCIMLIEDIDRVSIGKEEGEVPMSALLNIIDGVGASEDRILFITANDISKIDPAITRCGRIDKKYLIDYSTEGDLRKFYENVSLYFEVISWESLLLSMREKGKYTIADAQSVVFKQKTFDIMKASV